MKKVVVISLLFIGFLLPTTLAHAEENTSTSEITVNMQTLNNITNTTNTVSVYGSTLYSSSSLDSSTTVDTVGLRIYLQRKQSSWVNTTQSKEYTDSNTSSISRTTSFQLQRGYYYRVKIVHFIKDNGSYESDITYSSIIDFR
ncbi:hypothetical protein BN1058_02765 [Paraliobacillus sp. PM-2]|uniref:hypothetical protein n=1 Tax=Paraliobacillus sp. PM-2 TaxID=1462524 RepID=UPI00061C5F96|nr:hypothetical protein [Paraliobacillus sp. PM-2]CQR48397.1 hypothetical protein BN1058_02765 [Paraliobacillus sp. PM-2]